VNRRGQIGPLGALLALSASGMVAPPSLAQEIRDAQERDEREVYLRNAARYLGLVEGLSLGTIEETLRLMNERSPVASIAMLERERPLPFRGLGSDGCPPLLLATYEAPRPPEKRRPIAEKKARRAKRKQRRQR
jgi:hypothetical protein